MTAQRNIAPTPIQTEQPEQVHPEYLALVRDLIRVTDELGEAGLEQEPHATNFARMLTIAPVSYYARLDERSPGSAQQWRAWANDQIERHDYQDFFQLLKQIGDIRREHGDEALHDQQHAGLFVRMMRAAPPRYLAEADAIAVELDLMPRPTHVNEAGEPVYSLEQIAIHLDAPVDELRMFADEHGLTSASHLGAVYPIQ